MRISFDRNKNRLNIARHGLSFEEFSGFDTEPVVRVDSRIDYDETRFRGYGRIASKGYCIVFTKTADGFRLISFRRAHDKEMRRYE